MTWHKEAGWFHRSKNHVMVRSAGRAVHQSSKAVHWILAVGTGLLLVTGCLLAAAAWRLAQSPIDLGPWSDRLQAAIVNDAAPFRISFNGVFLAWEGFHKGADNPLDLRLANVAITDPTGRVFVTAPRAHITVSLAGLLLGRIFPRAIEVDRAQVELRRDVGGMISVGAATARTGTNNAGSIDLRQIRQQLSRPANSDHGRRGGLFDQIQRAHFRETDLTFSDRETGIVVRTHDMDLDLVRAQTGHIGGSLRANLMAGDQQAGLMAHGDWAADSGLGLDIGLTSFRPAGIGVSRSIPPLVTRIDAPTSLSATVGFNASFELDQIRADIQVGQGQIRVGQGNLTVRSGSVSLFGHPEDITITRGRFDLAESADRNPELVDIGGTVMHKADRLEASLTLTLGQIDIADLPHLWPLGVADNARPWVTQHVTAGTVTRGSAAFVVEADDALRDIVLTKASGDLYGFNGVFTWIDNIPATKQTDFHIHLADPDTLEIYVSSAHQQIRNSSADLLIKGGQMRITGLSLQDQIAVIHIQVDGQLTSALSLLKEPRLHLLSAHPIALKAGGGEASATLDVRFPLESKLQINDILIRATAHLEKVRLLEVVGNQGLNNGAFDFSIGRDGLVLKGAGTVGAVPVVVNGAMDFTSGPPDQVVQRIAVTGQPDAAQLDYADVNVSDFLTGPVPLAVAMIERRNGNASITINGDLTPTTIAVNPLAWNKRSGDTATASATLLLSHRRLAKIDSILLRGDGLLLKGSAACADGQIRTLLLDDIRLGRTQGRGTVHLKDNQPVAVVLQGDQIDLSPKLTEKTSRSKPSDTAKGMNIGWTLDARFDHAILANGERAGDLLVNATGVGQAVRLLDAVGMMQAHSGFFIKIGPEGGRRHLLVEAKDAGGFLRAIDAVRGMQSGHLMIDAILDSPFDFHPIAGTATIDNAVVKNSPALGKLLQAITLYGLVDALRGPGMTFSNIVVPFHYDGVNLNMDQAHAYNSSLGLTADGKIALSSGATSLTGTIVPAYFFNSVLGQVPLVGKLFSPEKGGGVFAARFKVGGRIDDPTISINPVSALTPGFLRGIFDMFGHAPAGGNAAPGDVK